MGAERDRVCGQCGRDGAVSQIGDRGRAEAQYVEAPAVGASGITAVCPIAGDGAAGDMAVNNDDFIACSASASPGDAFDIFTDGERWYVDGISKDASEVPFATAAG